MNLTGRPFPTVARWLLRPVGWPLHLLAAWTLASSIWGYRLPGTFGASILSMLLWLIVIVIWLGRHLAQSAIGTAYRRPSTEWRWRWGHSVVAPLLLLLWIAVPRGLPFRIAFALSRASLDRFIERVEANPAGMSGVHWVGLYRVSVDGIRDDGIYIYTGPDYDGARSGFAYFTKAPPRPAQGESWSHYHLDGPWYRYWDHSWPTPRLPTTLPSTFPSVAPVAN